MCGRFFRHGVSWEEYRDSLDIIPPENVDPPEAKYNIAPMTISPVVRRNLDTHEMEMFPSLWGLVPSWWNKPLSEKKFSTFNARVETAHEAASYRGAFRHKRCLIPVSGFYEWSRQGNSKIPFAIGLRNRRWFCFGGLWDCAHIDGSELNTFTILTTQPNDLMAGIHTRMPVIIHPDNYARWIDGDYRKMDDLFEPYPTDEMHAWVVDPKVGNVRNQGPELIEEV
ncbi:SOS response-associated peptidase [Ponticaulis sp.]|uniref:SOS response-associated peptidase n=1 Tax=Ponticaulis sp. TaxID=2020902 RepID=UPI002620F46E|nr:SOS response-associated peptidase [Ponticaulis sp.]MDF1679763.1 SOS response-associated peptidase [Ponticaulis sp.]